MCPPLAAPISSMGFDDSKEDIFKSLENMISGFPLPDNVIDYVNPFNYPPSNLPVDCWYLLRTKEMEKADFGFWKVKEESMLLSNPVITGWRTTHEFFGGQVPNEYGTEWLMHEYWITKSTLGENNHVKEASTLCWVCLSNEQVKKEMQQSAASSQITSKSYDNLRQSVDQQAGHSSGCGAPCNPEENKNDDMSISGVAGRPLNHQDPPEIDYVRRGEYMELLDLENPASPSSSSDNSSCLTISSDGCFDSMAFMRELESETCPDAPEHAKNCKFSVSTCEKTDMVVVLPTSPGGAFVEVEENIPQSGVIIGADSQSPDQTEGNSKNQNDEVPKHSTEKKEDMDNAHEGPAPNHGDAGSSSRSAVGGKKDAKGRKEKLKRKYLCFVPFQMFF